MRILGLDISTHTGWSFFENYEYKESGSIHVKVNDFNVNNFPEKSLYYPYNIIDAADSMASMISDLYHQFEPNVLVLENTVRGRNRNTTRILEFTHKAVLDRVRAGDHKLVYMDPSQWRKILEIRLSNDDKKSNKDVSKGLKRGRIGKKHLSVRYVNEKYNKKFKMKDNDECEAILLSLAYITSLGK